MVRLRHMLEAAEEAMGFAQGKDRRDLDHDRLLVLGLSRCLEIVGEAAAKVSPEARQAIPDLPWADIVGMRNRIIHAYFEVDLDLFWQTIALDLPALVGVLRAALKEE